MVNWEFRQTEPNEVESEPINAEFFSSEISQSDVLVLVRESIQNSLDAKVDSHEGSVNVRFFLGIQENPELNQKYFASLDEHLAASLGSQHALGASGNCKYLVVEDFNTIGLLGNVLATSAEAKRDPKNNGYRYFAWKFGDSSKIDGKRGNWGVGKVVFPKLSRIKSYFAYSVRLHNGKTDEILFGQSLLKYHDLHNVSYCPNGWWGNQDPASSRQIPFTAGAAQMFADDWNLSRRPDQTGLSVVVPFVPAEVTVKQLVGVLIADYFAAIWDGSLEVTVSDFSGTKTELNRSTLIGEVNTILDQEESDSIRGILEICNTLSLDEVDELPKFTISGPGDNKWATATFESESHKDTARKLVLDGRPILFEVSTKVPKSVTNNSEVIETFEVLMIPKEGRRATKFYRQGILISNANPDRISNYVSLVRVNSGELANLLGASEGPAHYDWSDGRERFQEKYPNKAASKDVLIWVRRAVSNLAQMLDVENDVKDRKTFANVFQRQKPASSKSDPTRPKTDPPNPPDAKPKLTRILKQANGFKIAQGQLAESAIGRKATVTVAYSLRRGNPFKRWVPADFDLASLVDSKSVSGLSFSIEDNKISIEILEEIFELKFSGFDPIRDLAIEVKEELF